MINLNSINLNSVNLGGLVLSGVKLGYPSLGAFDPASFDQAWTVTGKTNDDEDRATVKNLTGNGNNLVLSNFAFAKDSGYGLYKYDFKTFNYAGPSTQSTKYSDKFVIDKVNTSQVNVIISSSQFKCKVKVSGLSESISLGEVSHLRIYESAGISNIIQLSSDGIYDIDISSSSNIYLFVVGPKGTNDNPTVLQSPVIIEQIPDYEGYLVTDGVDDSVRALNINLGENFTLIGEWRLFSDTPIVNAGMSLLPQLHIFNRPSDGININFRSVSTTLYVKTLKAICSDGRCYDDDWNDLNINVGDTISSNINTLFLGYNGTNFTKIAFKNLAIYNRVLTKEQCIKAYDYLQTLKEK